MATSEVILKSAKEYRGLDHAALRESAEEMRRQLSSMKVQLVADQKVNAGIKRKSRKNLARIMTVLGETKLTQSPAKKKSLNTEKVLAPKSKKAKSKSS